MTQADRRRLVTRAVALGLERAVAQELVQAADSALDAVELLGRELAQQDTLLGRRLRGELAYAEEVFGLE